MVWPRRSAPLPSKRITPSRAPCGIEGSVTFSSVDFEPAGFSARNQISQYAAPLLVILVPSFWRAWAFAEATSVGGRPAGSVLYGPSAPSTQNASGERKLMKDNFLICTMLP